MYRRIIMFSVCLISLSAWQTTSVAYKMISDDIRLVTIYEGIKRTGVVGKKIEMKNPERGWFEAKKSTSGTFQFTLEGKRNLALAIEEGGQVGGGD